jgi:hypothetical protein
MQVPALVRPRPAVGYARADGRLWQLARGGLGICEGFLLNKLNSCVIAAFN